MCATAAHRTQRHFNVTVRVTGNSNGLEIQQVMMLPLSIQTFYKWSNSNYVIQDDCDAIFAAAAGYQTILPSMMCATDPDQSASFGDFGGLLFNTTYFFRLEWSVITIIIVVLVLHPSFLESPINRVGSKPQFVPITRILNRFFSSLQQRPTAKPAMGPKNQE